MILTKQTGNW